jgi:GAF domain-containing protein
VQDVTTSLLDRNLDEDARLAVLHDYHLLDALADYELQAVVRVAAALAEVPTSAINLMDRSRQRQLATAGFDGADSPRDESMCAVQFRTGRFVHVADCTTDETYASNPWVTGERGDVRFYASAPLITPEGYVLGTLCVFDTVAKSLRPDQVSRLVDLADVVVALFERRRHARAMAELAAAQERTTRLLEKVMDTIDVGMAVADVDGHITIANRAAGPLLETLPEGVIPDARTTPDGTEINVHRVMNDCDDVVGTVIAITAA